MKICQKIKESRKKRGWTLKELGDAVSLPVSTLCGYESEKTKVEPNISTLCKIADALDDLTILTHHCQSCPVRDHVFLKQFPDLNNIRRDPAIIASRLRKEMMEAAAAIDLLTERFSDADFKSRPDYHEHFMRAMEQVIDAKRAIEILEFELIISGAHSSLDLQKVYEKQQEKCVANGHHKLEGAAA